MNLYLIRHGTTYDNEKKCFSGWKNEGLSAYGIQQAEQLAAFFRHRIRKPFGLYCSDLKRTTHTAEIIGSGHRVEPEASPLLRELNFGKWEGLTWEQISTSYPEELQYWLKDPFGHSPPEGESLEEMGMRVELFLNKRLKPALLEKDVLLVTHGGTIRLFLLQLLSLRGQGFWDLNINTASISLLSYSEEKFESVYINRTLA